jgi:cob(I)alamin adenosyltransferase
LGKQEYHKKVSDPKRILKKDYIQIYTRSGKGKTTAALGLAIRAAGCGMKILIAQFMKTRECSEIKALERFSDLITLKKYGQIRFIKKKPVKKDIELAKKGIEEVKKMLASGQYDLVVLDEINIAEFFKLISIDEIIALIETKPKHVELVLTGRKTDPRIIEKADLVTEMREIKHYYSNGIKARKVIEN